MIQNKLSHPFILLLYLITTIHHAEAHPDSTSAPEQYPQFRVVGFLQQQFIDDYTTGISSQFIIHRARVGVAGRITDRIGVNIVGGATEPPDDTPRLVNAFVDINLHQLMNIRTGQFLVPFGIEGPEVIIFNPAIERSTALRRLNTFRMFRDIGVQLSGRYSTLSYAFAMVNGTGANPTVNTPNNDLVGRIAIEPINGFEVGVSGHLGYFQSQTDETRRLNRIGFDFNYGRELFIVRGEYIIRRDENLSDNYLTHAGGYLLGGLRIDNNWELLGRVERYEPDTSADNNRYTGITLGFNYYIKGQTRISANYEFRTDNNFSALGNLLTVQMQLAL